MLNGFGLKYYPASSKAIIENELDLLSELIEGLLEKTSISLASAIDNDSLLVYFKFPSEIKAACHQYLVYFTQFMADLGSKVDVALKEQIEYTLFKITPKDEGDGLVKIYEALGVYLNAPGKDDFAVQVAVHSDLAIKQWEANYYHLKSQIVLANSIIQAKEATIDMLQLANYQYKQLVDLNESKKDEKEDVIKGIVALKKFEGKGFVVDFAEILRRLKRVIKS